ncbi:zinc finger, CCHC-type containing protein [Tanacetum coccineum]
MAAAMKHMVAKFSKIDMFERVDLRRWHKKMHFLLSSMSVVYVLTIRMPEDGENATMEQIRKRSKWENDDYVYRDIILNVMEQYNELLSILDRFTQHKMNMDEAIQVSCTIDKLPHTWKDYKHTLKHKKEELTLVELSSHLCIKESLRVQDSDKPKGNNVVGPSVVNMVEHNNSFRYTENKGKCKHQADTKADPNKKSKVTCWKCGKPKHLKKDCKGEKVSNKVNGSGISGLGNSSVPLKGYNMFNKSLQDYYVTYVSESNYVQDDDVVWAVVRLPNPKLKTLSERGIECIFDGYAEHSKAFRFYIIEPNESVLINSIIESQDAIFDENRFSSVPRPCHMTPKNFGTEFQLYLIKGTRDEVFDQHSYYFNVEDKPKTFDEAMKLQDVTFWKEAINDEMNSIMGNNNWMLADLPPGCKWIFKKKMKVDGTIKKFKARGGAISWASKKQTCITNLTMEFEFVALAAAGKEAEWLKILSLRFLYGLNLWHNMICGLIINVVVSIEFVRSQQNLVDHLTKGMASDLVLKSAKRMGLKSNLTEAYAFTYHPKDVLVPIEKEDEVFTSQWLISLKKCLTGA